MSTTDDRNHESRAPLLSLRRVSRFYRPDRPALVDVSFDVQRGEFLYVAGASGAGKSTLLRLLHLAELPDTGRLLFAGHDVSQLRRTAISVLRRSTGVIFQDYKLISDLSVKANVGLPLEVQGFSPRRIRSRVHEVLERVGLHKSSEDLAGGLSGGEQQRVAVARAIVGHPELILADEPTGSLDTYSADYVLDLLEKARDEGATVVLATHDRMLMAARPHRTMALERGRMVGISSDGSRRRPAPGAQRDDASLERAV
ncbi:MAG: ATP-binding cassette domain-containing protein [Polyangia bacterium]